MTVYLEVLHNGKINGYSGGSRLNPDQIEVEVQEPLNFSYDYDLFYNFETKEIYKVYKELENAN